MLRKDRERDAAFAWEVFQKAPYATLSLTDEAGKPYAIPISPVVDEAYHVVYFHCAGHGEDGHCGGHGEGGSCGGHGEGGSCGGHCGRH